MRALLCCAGGILCLTLSSLLLSLAALQDVPLLLARHAMRQKKKIIARSLARSLANGSTEHGLCQGLAAAPARHVR